MQNNAKTDREIRISRPRRTRQSQTKQSTLFRRKNSEEIELAKDVTVSESYDMFTNVGSFLLRKQLLFSVTVLIKKAA